MPGIDDIFVRVIDDLEGPAYALTAAIGFLLGILLVASALMRLRSLAEGPRHDITGNGIAMRFVSGAMLVSLTATIVIGGTTLFNDGTNVSFQGLSYQSINPNVKLRAEKILSALFRFFNVCGWIFVMNSWRLFVKVADGDSHVAKETPYIHLGGGIALAYIVPFVKAVQTTFGWNIIT